MLGEIEPDRTAPELSCSHRTGSIGSIQAIPGESPNTILKATSHLTIFDIPMRPLREDQKHRLRFTR